MTIITKDVLAQVIEREIEQLGAKGFTFTSARGKRMGNHLDNPWEGENVNI
ncbi:MAG: hypothetical protein MUE75_15165 [Algoriphagus sp.]|nr:hypothetical protein [Algoriphagus sp.]